MDANKSVTANFIVEMEETFPLQVTIEPVDGGSVLIEPDQTTFNDGDVVTLTPHPEYGFTFDGWSGDDADDLDDNGDGTCSITMDADKSVIANFVEEVIDTKTYIFLPLILNLTRLGVVE